MPPLPITLDIGDHIVKATAEIWENDLCFFSAEKNVQR